MRRRQVLAAVVTGVAGALAGCSNPRASLRMDAVDDDEIAERYAQQPDRLRDEHRPILVDAVEDGNVTADTAAEPFDPGRPLDYNGSYYDLSHEAVSEREATRYGLRVDYDPGEGAGEIGDIDYADLPAVDREALDGLLPPDDDPPSGDGFDLGMPAVYGQSEAERSVLVPDQEYDVVVHEGERYLLDATDPEPATLTTYRYTADVVADDEAAMATVVREQFRFELTGLSAAQRKIVDAARDGGYIEGEPSGAFRDLVGRFRDREAIEADEYGGEWLVRYEGADYWADLETPISWHEATVARQTPTEY